MGDDRRDRRGSGLALRIIAGACLFVTLFALGFLACAAPATTHALSSATSEFDSSPYAHDELIMLADDTRALTVDVHPDGWDAAQERMSMDIVAAAQTSASDQSSQHARWNPLIGRVDIANVDASDPDACMQAVAQMSQVSDRFALDADAFSHLHDCNRIITAAYPILLAIACVAILGLIRLFRASEIDFSRTVVISVWTLIAFMGACAIACVIDFDGFFAAFHGVFFPQGNWTFSARSLLITMLPTDFWIGMGAVWLTTTIVACIVMLVIAHRVTLRARKVRH